MSIRRGLMAQMASGANFVKGTFTVPSIGSSYTLNFGKTFSKYMFFIEMTNDSKTALLQIGATSARAFFVEGIYPSPSVNNVQGTNVTLVCRVTPSTGEITYGQNNIFIKGIDDTHIDFAAGGTGNTNAFYNGYSYNYYIVEIK